MATVKKISEVYNFNSKIASGTATISYEKGKWAISSDTDIMGIEINFKGKVNITPQLPEGWYLQGNTHKIIIFTLQNLPIKNQLLFTYEGVIHIKNIIVVNSDAKKFKCVVKKDLSQWANQSWSLDTEADTWDNFKNIIPNGKVSKTKYNLPDYNLPKVNKRKIKKTKVKTSPNRGGGRSSRGSGGY